MTLGEDLTAETVATDSPVAARRAGWKLSWLLICVGLLAFGVLCSIAIGSKPLALGFVIDALRERSTDGDGFIIWDHRIPRTAVGLVVGVGLGVSGALIQALTRNPLADPGILGVSAGASFAVAIAISVFGIGSIGTYVLFAFIGALAVTLAVYLIGSAGCGGADPIQLTLAGVALSAIFSGIVSGMVLIDPEAFTQLQNWNAGSIAGRGWDILLPVLPFMMVGLLLAGIAAAALNAIALGDDLARSLGANVTRARVIVIVAVTLLAGGATAIAGPIAFVGLMIPHVARWIVGPDQRWILVYTIVLSPILMLASDILGRVLIAPAEFPVGIVTAFVGAPVLVVLIRRKRVSGL